MTDPFAERPPEVEAAEMDRLADALLHLGFHHEAERLAHRAAALRNEISEHSFTGKSLCSSSWKVA
jgi:hypothetical protein